MVILPSSSPPGATRSRVANLPPQPSHHDSNDDGGDDHDHDHDDDGGADRDHDRDEENYS